MKQYDLVIIGGGVSGLTAAVSALEEGIENILIIEREEAVGGILNQCIYVGFGGEYFEEEVTGPEYINYFEEKVRATNVEVLTDSEVLSIDSKKTITFVNPKNGVQVVLAKCILLATGCRERYVGSINIATHKYTGIFTIGNAHRIVNLEGYLPGKEVVITVNSKWGFILARRIVIEGGIVKGVIIDTEKESYIGEEDLDIIEGFDIPVYYGYKILDINGKGRVEEVKLLNYETKESVTLGCDSLLLSVGYLSESSLAVDLGVEINENRTPIVNDFSTNILGIFACGAMLLGNEILRTNNINGNEAGKKCAQYLNEYC